MDIPFHSVNYGLLKLISELTTSELCSFARMRQERINSSSSPTQHPCWIVSYFRYIYDALSNLVLKATSDLDSSAVIIIFLLSDNIHLT